VADNVERIAKLEAAHAGAIGPLDRVSARITSFAGGPAFLGFHALWFTVWISWNLSRAHPIDPYPFTFLTFLVSLEAIFLTSFVLISQKHMDQQSHRRAALDLQINLLAEKEMTKVLKGSSLSLSTTVCAASATTRRVSRWPARRTSKRSPRRSISR